MSEFTTEQKRVMQGSDYVVAFYGEGAMASVHHGWEGMNQHIVKEMAAEEGSDERRYWEDSLADLDNWRCDEGGLPYSCYLEVGECASVEIIRLSLRTLPEVKEVDACITVPEPVSYGVTTTYGPIKYDGKRLTDLARRYHARAFEAEKEVERLKIENETLKGYFPKGAFEGFGYEIVNNKDLAQLPEQDRPMSFEDNPADDRYQLDQCIDEIKSLKNEIERLDRENTSLDQCLSRRNTEYAALGKRFDE